LVVVTEMVEVAEVPGDTAPGAVAESVNVPLPADTVIVVVAVAAE
jgi:hypothetical protein